MKVASSALGLLSAVVALSATSALSEVRLTEGFILDNMVRDRCQIGPGYDAFMEGMFAKQYGFEAVAEDDTRVTFTHPDSITMVHIPKATEGPTCVMTVAAGVVDQAMFDDFLGITLSNIPTENQEPVQTVGEGQIWRYVSAPYIDSGIQWATELTRTNDGALRFENRPILPE